MFRSRIAPFSAALLLWSLAIAGCPGPGDRGLDDVDPTVRASAIKNHPAAADRSDVPILVERLLDEDDAVAWVAWHELARRTGVKFGSPRTEAGRREAADGWLQWHKKRPKKASGL